MIVLGLTGGIASGKSTISEIIKSYGIPVIDGDLISREIVQPESMTLELLKKEFGSNIIEDNGELNRKKLGTIVFNDSDKLEKLNSITHPFIKEEVIRRIDSYRIHDNKLCVLDAAILIEANFTDITDYIILVYVAPKVQLERLMKRDNFSEQEALRRINSQMSFDNKLKFADFILDNSKDIEYTKLQINKILEELLCRRK